MISQGSKRRHIMKIFKRLCIVLVLLCGLITIRATANTQDDLQSCLHSCGNAYDACMYGVDQSYISCMSQCTTEDIECNAEAWSNYNWCIQFRCGNEWNTGACGEQCDSALGSDLNICSAETAICESSPYSEGCYGSYEAGRQACESNDENCEEVCLRDWPS